MRYLARKVCAGKAMRKAVTAAVLVVWAGGAGAETPPVKTAELGDHQVTIHLWPFLLPEEVAALELVLGNKDALALFVPEGAGGFAAMAVAPDDGFIREGALVPSATALAGMETEAAAAEAALAACDGARKGEAACAVVLEVAPK